MEKLHFKHRIRFDNGDGFPVIQWTEPFNTIPESTSKQSRSERLDLFRFRNVRFLIDRLQNGNIKAVNFVQDLCRHAEKIDGIQRLGAVTDRVVKIALDTTTYSHNYFSSKVWIFELNASDPTKWTMGTDFDFENPYLLRPYDLKRRLIKVESNDDDEELQFDKKDTKIERDPESELVFSKHRHLNHLNKFQRKPPIDRVQRRRFDK